MGWNDLFIFIFIKKLNTNIKNFLFIFYCKFLSFFPIDAGKKAKYSIFFDAQLLFHLSKEVQKCETTYKTEHLLKLPILLLVKD